MDARSLGVLLRAFHNLFDAWQEVTRNCGRASSALCLRLYLFCWRVLVSCVWFLFSLSASYVYASYPVRARRYFGFFPSRVRDTGFRCYGATTKKKDKERLLCFSVCTLLNLLTSTMTTDNNVVDRTFFVDYALSIVMCVCVCVCVKHLVFFFFFFGNQKTRFLHVKGICIKINEAYRFLSNIKKWVNN